MAPGERSEVGPRPRAVDGRVVARDDADINPGLPTSMADTRCASSKGLRRKEGAAKSGTGADWSPSSYSHGHPATESGQGRTANRPTLSSPRSHPAHCRSRPGRNRPSRRSAAGHSPSDDPRMPRHRHPDLPPRGCADVTQGDVHDPAPVICGVLGMSVVGLLGGRTRTDPWPQLVAPPRFDAYLGPPLWGNRSPGRRSAQACRCRPGPERR